MIIEWRLRRNRQASADRGIFWWSRVAQGSAVVSHTATGANTVGAFTSAGLGSVKVDAAGANTVGPWISQGLGPHTDTGVGGGGWQPKRRRVNVHENEDWKESKAREEALIFEAQEIYERFAEDKCPAKQAKAVAKAVEPFAQKPAEAPQAKTAPKPAPIDFRALAASAEGLKALAKAMNDQRVKRIAQEIEDERDDMDAIEAILTALH